jgi:hypothetical protein
MRKLRPAQHYFIDESGDLVLFDASGRCIVGQPGVSRTFTLGAAWIKNPEALQSDLAFLRLKLLGDGYFSGVPSFQPEARKTALYFHAKDDLPEVRREVFQVLRAHEMHVVVAIRRKNILADFAARRFAETGVKVTDHEIYDGLVERVMRDCLHLAEHSHIWFARRGKRERKQALESVIAKARASFTAYHAEALAARMGDRQPQTTIYSAHASEVAGLQAIDYCLWALSRVLERGEMRYFEYLKPKYRMICDIDDVRRRATGEYYNAKGQRKFIDATKILPVVS